LQKVKTMTKIFLNNSFRHRQHPRDNERKNLNLNASNKFNNEQINKVIKIK
jgi:hypothetical protein